MSPMRCLPGEERSAVPDMGLAPVALYGVITRKRER